MSSAIYTDFLHSAVWFLAVAYLISGLDELVMTVAFLVWQGFRRLVLLPGNERLNIGMLKAKPEQRAAIMVPAWQEAAVIGRMVRFAIAEIDYADYTIFVGVYPNDPDTIAAVERVRSEHPDRVRIALVPNPGPTTKSDCLNAILRAARDWGRETGRDVDFYVLQDAEDYVPRYGLRLFNFLIPRKAIVQIPVFPLSCPWWALTQGHYMDEFAQLHLKDLRVREWLTGGVPSAGVGTAFSREAIAMAWEDRLDGAFRPHLLTEDYEISMQLLRRGARSAFFIGNLRDAEPGPAEFRLHALPGLPAVRGEFPAAFWASVRQKTRWTLGITLQGWESLGWYGDFWQRYILFRDRKPLVTNLMNVVAYSVLAAWLVPRAIAAWFFPEAAFPALLPQDPLLHVVVELNFLLLAVFLCVRFACTYIAYGPVHAAMSLPRVVWGNLVNFAATCRAVRQYVSARRKGIKNIPWEKTAHADTH